MTERRTCGCPVNDRHNWNCPLTPVYMRAYWDADPTPKVSRKPEQDTG